MISLMVHLRLTTITHTIRNYINYINNNNNNEPLISYLAVEELYLANEM